ncbi:MAG TPA: IS30 family transposase, partial [bacterium]|nr:IS30 family transposase [bacterium]
MSQQAAAAQVGINVRTARDWDHGVRHSRNSRFYPDGRRVDYTTGQTTMEAFGSPQPGLAWVEQVLDPRFLSLAEREQIADLRQQGQSYRAIGRRLGRQASTIQREVTRNATATGTYQPHAAHRLAAARRPRPKASKLAEPGPLRTYVTDRLQEQWSPEQISQTLPAAFPDDEGMRVSTETIYQAIYVQTRGGLKREVVAALRSGRTRRKPQRTGAQRTSRFSEPMVMLSERPAEAEDRAVT